MDQPDRKPIEADAQETLVVAARRFMALHPDVRAVALTVVSTTIDPRALSTVVVGGGGPLLTPDAWLLVAKRLVEAAEFCTGNVKELFMGLDELASNMAREVERLRAEARDAAPPGPDQPDRPNPEIETRHGER